ncbi:hypothetical protein RRG08_031579 [Elysia crispata]|uniref:Uncharacterized protein n=1 Tax=Elysia crispata TaxID=231223 RepID=A0AAE1B452_9GAST|nr:hypothetical protein RRG08_031579 [Elysia crispata]
MRLFNRFRKDEMKECCGGPTESLSDIFDQEKQDTDRQYGSEKLDGVSRAAGPNCPLTMSKFSSEEQVVKF